MSEISSVCADTELSTIFATEMVEEAVDLKQILVSDFYIVLKYSRMFT